MSGRAVGGFIMCTVEGVQQRMLITTEELRFPGARFDCVVDLSCATTSYNSRESWTESSAR
jgi:hypothetical protein